MKTVTASNAYRTPQAKILAQLANSVLNGAELHLSGKYFRYSSRTGFMLREENSPSWIIYGDFVEWRTELDKAVTAHYSPMLKKTSWTELYRRSFFNRDYGEFTFSAVRV